MFKPATLRPFSLFLLAGAYGAYATAQPAQAPAAAPATPAVEAAPTAATLLPSINVESTEQAASFTPPVQEATTSMGTTRFSIFFSPVQMRALEQALGEYERNAPVSSEEKTDLTVDFAQPAEVPKIVEPDPYPVFYLSSIAYRAANDWSIWVSGHKITSQKNSTDLQVLSVSPTQVSFAWKPVYAEAITKRKSKNLFASTTEITNKLSKPARFNFDDTAGVATFTLRPNQTFAPAYMNSFEGFVESPKLAPMAPEEPAAAGDASLSEVKPAANGKPIDTTANMSTQEKINAQLARQPVPRN